MIGQLVNELAALGVELRVEGDQLRLSAPRGTLTPALVERLRTHKPAVIEFLRQRGGNAGAGAQAIPRIARDGGMPLGFVQQRMWLLDRMDPESTASNLPGSWLLRGALDVSAFRAALNEVVRRHEILRTRIVWDGVTPRQVAEPRLVPELPVIDLTNISEDERHAELLRHFEKDRERVFDLGVAPLFRARLYRMAADRHVFFFMPHHVIWDGWSFDILLSEMATLYAAFAEGRPSPLPELRVQYADYASWHRQWIESGDVERQRQYWRGRLAKPLPVLELPLLRPRPAIMSQRGRRALLPLDASLVEQLRVLGRDEGATLFMVLLAAYKAFLFRYTGQSDIIVGAPVQDRVHVDAERMIGVFVNTLVLRTHVDGHGSFRELLRQVRDGSVAAYDNQSVPFDQLVEDLQPERSLSHTPLFQTLFTFQETTDRPAQFGDLTVTQVHVPTHSAPTDVLYGIMASERSTLGLFDFNADLFDEVAAERFTAGYSTMLASIVAAADSALTELEIVPARERELLRQFNATEADVPSVGTVEALIARHVAVRGDRAAVQDERASLSYHELDARAAHLAAQLKGVGAQPGELIGISLDRSTDLVAAVIAVWKLGCAYVPLDPEYPAERTAYVLSDSGARFVITSSAMRGRLPAGIGYVCTDDGSVRNPERTAAPIGGSSDDLAYVIYTSGSTGLPKGVRVPHRAVINFLESMRLRPGLGEDDVLLAVTTLSFDISVLELFLPLTQGATVFVASADVARDGVSLSELMAEVRPTVMQATPSTWQMLFDAGWTGAPGLKALCGGEALGPELARRLVSIVRELWNMYGPTETTIWSTCGRVMPGDARVTIGQPIANTRVHVLDRHGQLAPIGVPGEAIIAGDGVASGYHNRPELTAERFVADPTDPRGGMAYRTGDLARWLDDGRLEHLGRIDRQVKLNGFRIEPAEVEAALERLPAVRQAAVDVRGDQDNRRLVAYVVFNGQKELTSTELRRELNRTLPPYMIPALVVPLTELPLTANGKVDYKALPNPLDRHRAARVHEAPVGDVEVAIASVWSQLLGVKVGRHDNFFELGGHSLLSIRAVTKIEAELGLRVDPRLFFFQTLHQISAGVAKKPTVAAR